jgi:hypothetical protein
VIEDLIDIGFASHYDVRSAKFAPFGRRVDAPFVPSKRTGLSGIDPQTARDARLGVERLIGLEEHYRIEESTVEAKGAQR